MIVQNTDPAVFRLRVDAAQRVGNPRPVVLGMPVTGVLTITAHDSLFAAMSDPPGLGGDAPGAGPRW